MAVSFTNLDRRMKQLEGLVRRKKQQIFRYDAGWRLDTDLRKLVDEGWYIQQVIMTAKHDYIVIAEADG